MVLRDQHINNVAVLRKMRREKKNLNNVNKRKPAFFEHILRNEKYELLERKMVDHKGLGRRGIFCLKKITF